jgi:alkylhydroperoxidase family enzyme
MPKTAMSRFHIHDDLTAPEASIPVLRGALAGGGRLPNFLGVLAGSAAALRGYTRMRSELRNLGRLAPATLERISLAVAEHDGSRNGIELHSRVARSRGVGIDEVALAREFDSSDPREAALLRYVRALLDTSEGLPMWVHEEAREVGWTEEELLETIAHVALERFTAMVNVAGGVPLDGSLAEAVSLRAA